MLMLSGSGLVKLKSHKILQLVVIDQPRYERGLTVYFNIRGKIQAKIRVECEVLRISAEEFSQVTYKIFHTRSQADAMSIE
jgi:hypothetical protein